MTAAHFTLTVTAVERILGHAKQAALALLLVALTSALQSCTAASSAAPSSAPSEPTTLQGGPQPASIGSTDRLATWPSDSAGQGRALTDYLNAHELPLIGASVVDDKTRRQIILYGFVATPAAKIDAEQKVRRISPDTNLMVVNRIIIRPELLAMNKPAESAQDSAGKDNAGDDDATRTSIDTQQSYLTPNQTQQYQQQSQPSWLSVLITVLTIAPIFIP